jgi:hypothetical protein
VGVAADVDAGMGDVLGDAVDMVEQLDEAFRAAA